VGVRRTFAGLLFGLAAASAAITVAGFLLQRTAFEPSSGSDTARVILGDPEIKDHLVVTIADAVSAELLKTAPNDANFTQKAVRARVRAVASTKAGAALLATVVRDAHERLIGERDAPVRITGQQLLDATQMQAAAAVPTITLDVPRIGILAAVDSVITWLVPLAGFATIALVAVAMATHPDRSALFKTLGLGLLLLALVVLVVAYVVPRFLVPALSTNPWANLTARLADNSLTRLIAVELVLVSGGLALLLSTGAMRRRRRWSTPVSTYRYQEERRWSG
jgi:hypothetical protein